MDYITGANLLRVTPQIDKFETTHSFQAGSVSQSTQTEPSKEQYQAIWSTWENTAPQGGGELRNIAVLRMQDCLERGSTSLDLAHLGLSSLPEIIPDQLIELNVCNNQLDKLPTRLPENLRQLYALNNCLTTLPEILPKNLTFLSLYNNNLTSLPKNLPENISELYLCKNALKKYPENLPPNIKYLDLSENNIEGAITNCPHKLKRINLSHNKIDHILCEFSTKTKYIDLRYNQIKEIPDGIMNLSPKADIDLLGNPLSVETFQKLRLAERNTEYSGPIIVYSMG